MSQVSPGISLPRFERGSLEEPTGFGLIGLGAPGGKASGLWAAREILESVPEALRSEALRISVPRTIVIGTDIFDLFVERNGLRKLAGEEPGDDDLARAFQAAAMPAEIAGDLWTLARHVRSPLAVRSSSLLEDAAEHPFAGVYETKMTPNDAQDPDTRFRRIVEAIKFVWASTFFRGARAAIRAAGHDPDDEKMAVIVQEIVGRRHGPRFYPDVSGVARSINFYPTGPARPDQGVVQLALGLGKTIVDGGRCWTYSPAHPGTPPPFASIDALLDESQRSFWAVRMGPPAVHDPTAEVEYLERYDLGHAEGDGTLFWLASTWNAERDRLVPGTGEPGARLLDFAPLLGYGPCPLNEAIREMLERFADRLRSPVEIEFAVTLPDSTEGPARLGFLQVRPLRLAVETVEVAEALLRDPRAVIASPHVLGNGVLAGIRDVVFVRRDRFDARQTRAIATEVGAFNRALVERERPYALVGFGRWGSADPWLGIPVEWAQISGARVIVEDSVAALNADMSQGSHFFHNLLGFRVAYFSVPRGGAARVDWEWLESLPAESEGEWVRHVRTPVPLVARVDGRAGRGVLMRDEEPPRA